MEATCEKLRVQFREAAESIRAKVRRAFPTEGAAGGPEAGGDAGTDGGVERGGTARVKLTVAEGPYDGATFEIVLEEDGEARIVGRSCSRKVGGRK